MSRSKSSSKSKAARVKELPWAALLQVGVLVGRRWRSLSAKDRTRLSSLVRASGGRLGNLNAKERRELRRLAGKLDLKGMARELALIARGGRKRRRRA